MYTERAFSMKPHDLSKTYYFRDTPTVCPICHSGIAPTRLEAAVSYDERKAEVCYRCTFSDCERLFIARYMRGTIQDSDKFRFDESVPLNYKAPHIPDEVRAASPSFVEIYEQALMAESLGLDQMVGIGLRKSAEFLVRDYLTAHPPLKKSGKSIGKPLTTESIAQMPFGNLVEHHVDDEGIRNMALRAWWLGSDDTHYIRKYEKHDLTDLKAVIRTMMGWVEKRELTARYTAEIQEHGSVVPKGDESQEADLSPVAV